MIFVKRMHLFIQSNLKKLQRKWFLFPLLLLFPILLIGLFSVIAISILTPEDGQPIHVGIVDLDKSQETEMVVNLIEESSQLSSFIKIDSMTEVEAEEGIENHLSAYISFPRNFTESLYTGDSVTINVIGNPDKETDTYLVKELLDSISKHIRASQANILTVNYYAKELPMTNEIRQELLFEQFEDFFIYTVGKDKIMYEEQVTNSATSSTVAYYGLAAWYMVLTIWLLAFYSFFTDDEQARMQTRMRLYSVTMLQQLTAKITTVFILTSVFASFALYLYSSLMKIPLIGEDYGRIALITGLFSLIYLVILAILEIIFKEQKIRLLSQSLFTIIVLLTSGAIIPTLYFPTYIQNLLPYLFASEAFGWLQDILLDGRLYADYLPLTLFLCAAVMVLIGASVWKERASGE